MRSFQQVTSDVYDSAECNTMDVYLFQSVYTIYSRVEDIVYIDLPRVVVGYLFDYKSRALLHQQLAEEYAQL